ncbi:beta-ketoacyl synthase N-terminal-like domain-containing protein, partial [Pseudomonas frederiksbergensis]|uniref:beta-ketoacyl synthase N-terminal-like domain-containing protein n=1 Tax=Pseudomonas frederiksbergensis TaxID=104087 RepID=UPI003D04B28D
MRRVVITGLGIVSCLGNDKETVSANLRASRPGIRFNPEYAEMGLCPTTEQTLFHLSVPNPHSQLQAKPACT